MTSPAEQEQGGGTGPAAGPGAGSAGDHGLRAALVALRDQIAAIRFVLADDDGGPAGGQESGPVAQREILDQLDAYVLPRVRSEDVPLLVVVAGSTGAGKSTLVNGLIGGPVSVTGVRRPTTSSPVLVYHPADRDWFGDRAVLPGMARVGEPSGRSVDPNSPEVVVVENERVPKGLALLDSPDIDSVVERHHELANKLLAAADLWLFVTTAARYADAPAWRLLQRAREQGATLGIVMSRVPRTAADQVAEHFAGMLADSGLGGVERFTVPETKVENRTLPADAVEEIHTWLSGIVEDGERRRELVRQTVGNVLDSFRVRVPELAKKVEAQAGLRGRLGAEVETAYSTALAELDEATRNGSLLRGEVLARWQDFASTGDLEQALHVRRSRAAHRHGGRRSTPGRVRALRVALRSSLESLVVAGAERAAEDALRRWRAEPSLREVLGERDAPLGRASPELVPRANRAIGSWQEHVLQVVRTEGVTKRSVAKVVSYDDEALAIVLMVGLLGFASSDVNVEGGTSAVPQRLLKALFGAESLRSMIAKARTDLRGRIGMLFDEESIRFGQTLDAAGIPDETVAVQLYQATYDIEVTR